MEAGKRTHREKPERLGERQRLRGLHKMRRDGMTAEAVREKSRMICEKVHASDWYAACTVLYAYYPLGHEADCRPLITQALAEGKCVALPRTAGADGQCHMDFFRITSLAQVKEGHFHVMEPDRNCPLIQGSRGLVLVPGVVFDAQGRRYGYGKGYYDRYFARFPELLRAALAFENQMEPELDATETDIAMERIYTERTVYLPDEEKGRGNKWN